MELSKVIKAHRKAAKLSQAALAALAGVGKTVIFDIESGKRTIRYDNVEKILKALNIQIQFDSPLIRDGGIGTGS